MYIRIKSGNVEYPYNIQNLRKDEHTISFPQNIDDTVLEQFGVYKVFLTPKPTDYTKNITEGIPQLIDGKYYQNWIIEDSTQEEINNRISFKWDEVREYRNQLLAECDWVVLADSPLSGEERDEWITYRLALRNITLQENPFFIQWPAKPM